MDLELNEVYNEVSEYLANKIYENIKELYEKAKEYNIKIKEEASIVYCRDCIHRPVYDEEENDLIIPPYNNGHQDCACPYICQEDFYLNRMPDKDFYCKFGEKENE